MVVAYKTPAEKLMEAIESQSRGSSSRSSSSAYVAKRSAKKVATSGSRVINNLREEVESSSSSSTYVVSYQNGRQEPWQCSCMGWTRHYPRHDCKHITAIKEDLMAQGKEWA
jgi:hypothetical protein